jgi:hypothetical protein
LVTDFAVVIPQLGSGQVLDGARTDITSILGLVKTEIWYGMGESKKQERRKMTMVVDDGGGWGEGLCAQSLDE